LIGALAIAAAACAPVPAVPDNPTWSDVEPILRAECVSCHGGSAAVTGSTQGVSYRLDFYDMSGESCGDAALIDGAIRFAAASSSQIAIDITSTSSAVRPRMPPEPSAWLQDWEWQTLAKWASNPRKGGTPVGNARPTIRITSPSRVVKKVFTLSVLLEDPDGESAVGALTIGDVTLRMDRPGAFSIVVDGSQWGLGRFPFRPWLATDGVAPLTTSDIS